MNVEVNLSAGKSEVLSRSLQDIHLKNSLKEDHDVCT